MSDKLKFVHCAPKRMANGVTTGRSTTHLPDDMMSDQDRRVLVFIAVVCGLWIYAALLNRLIVPVFLPNLAERGLYQRARPLEVSGAVLSALTWTFLRLSRSTDHVKTRIGLGFMVLNAMGIAVLNNWIAPVPPLPSVFVSWIAVLILAFSI